MRGLVHRTRGLAVAAVHACPEVSDEPRKPHTEEQDPTDATAGLGYLRSSCSTVVTELAGLMQPPLYENRLALATMERNGLIQVPIDTRALATRGLNPPQFALATMRLMQPRLVVRGCSPTGLSSCMPVARTLRTTKKKGGANATDLRTNCYGR